MEKLQAIKGTYDILPGEAELWQYVEGVIREICKDAGFGEIRIPVFERTELFSRGVGDTTDVVQKEMYTFEDKGKRSLTLRPEGTAGVVRSVLEPSVLAVALPVKLYYLLTCYRNEKPQAGRFREFRQFGVEAFGSMDPALDAEIISLAVRLMSRLGLTGLKVNINSIGCPVCRKKYNGALRAFLEQNLDGLCGTCKTRYEKNPLRILDCKEEACKKITENAPVMTEYLCDECRQHFEGLQNDLKLMDIQYEIDPKIVRGLDYYTKTVFEITSDSLGAQSTVCGGGRYDGLVEELGGNATPGIGFGLGLERLLLCMKAQGISLPSPARPKLFICELGDAARAYGVELVNQLRNQGISVLQDYMGRGLKGQMKYADKTGAEYCIVLGDSEIESGTCALKHMESGESREIQLEFLKEALS